MRAALFVLTLALGGFTTVRAVADEPLVSGKGRIYIGRSTDERFPSLFSPYINGKELVRGVAPGECIYVDLAPGKYTVHTMSMDDPVIKVVAGHSYAIALSTIKQGTLLTVTSTVIPALPDQSLCVELPAP